VKTLQLPAFLLFSIVCACSWAANAQELGFQTTFSKSKPFVFMENKGQLADFSRNGSDKNALSDISYYAKQNGVNIYFKKDRVMFVFASMDTKCKKASDTKKIGRRKHQIPDSASIQAARMEMQFVNANPEVQIISENLDPYTENYYGKNADEGITAHGYKKLTYKNIWPFIDLIFDAGKAQGMEYSFVVNPGAHLADIQLQWNGTDSLSSLGETMGLKFVNPLGWVQETGLKAYQNSRNLPLGCRYNLGHENQIGFLVDSYDPTNPLIIDPELIWGTYFGGGDYDESYGVKADTKGNVYFTGYSSSSSGIATTGAYQTSYLTPTWTSGQTYYGFLAKFDSSGSIDWATYYGGNYTEDYAVTTDTAGDIYITGWTIAGDGIASSGAFQTSYDGGNGNGTSNAFLAKFTPDGKRAWGTYFGRKGGTSGSTVTTDVAGNVYLGGATNSQNIATSGAFQTSFTSCYPSYTDIGFLAKFTSGGSLKWCTYFGECSSLITSIAADSVGYVYILGSSNKNGLATSGAYQTSIQGTGSIFLAKINTSGGRVWCTYFGGDAKPDGLSIDKKDNIFICGQVYVDKSIPNSPGFQSYAGNYDAFLAKFNKDDSLEWATYYGGSNSDEASAICNDLAGNVYITGSTTSATGMATSGAYQTSWTYGLNRGEYLDDAFIARFNTDGKRTWATYYGGDNEDIGTGISVDPKNNIYITGNTYGSSNLATSGAFQSSYTAESDAFLAKFRPTIVDAGIPSILQPSGIFCYGKNTIKVMLKNYGKVDLHTVNINASINRITQSVYTWSGDLAPDSTVLVTVGPYMFLGGIDTIKTWTSLPNGITDSYNGNDTAYLRKSIASPPVANAGGDTTICQGTHITLGSSALTGYSYVWTSKPSGFTSSASKISLSPDSSAKVYLTATITATGCSTIDSAQITVNPSPIPIKMGDIFICSTASDSVPLGGATTKGYNYAWTSKPAGFTSSISNPKVKANSTAVFYLTETITATGCSAVDSAKIIVLPPPGLDAGGNHVVCAGTQVTLGKNPVAGYTYAWVSSPAGYSSSLANPAINPITTTTYFLTESIVGSSCISKDSALVTVNPIPKAIVGIIKSYCAGDTANLHLGAPEVSGHSYAWTSNPSGFSSSQSDPTDVQKTNTTYYLTETITATGCQKMDSISLVFHPLPAANTGPNKYICFGGTTSLGIASIAGDKYQWTSVSPFKSDTNSRISVHPDSTTEYFLTETDIHGCSKTHSVQVTALPPPKPKLGLAHITCAGDALPLGTNLVSGHSYSWSSSNGGTFPSQPKIIVSQDSTAWFTVKETDSLTGCSGVDSVLVFVNPTPAPKIKGKTTICGQDQGNIYSTPFDSGSTYHWTLHSGNIMTGVDSNVANAQFKSGRDTLIVLETNTNGCKKRDTLLVQDYDLPNAQFTYAPDSPAYRFKAADTLETSCQWDFGDGGQAHFDTAKHVFHYPADSFTKVSLSISNAFGCTSVFDTLIKIHFFPPPKFLINVFPNPFQKDVTVRIELEKAAQVQILLFDELGRRFGTLADVYQQAGIVDYTIDADALQLADAYYIVEIFVDGKKYVRPVLRIR